jgi:hypothetical protein
MRSLVRSLHQTTDRSHENTSADSSISKNLSNLNLPKDGQLNFTGDVDTEVSIFNYLTSACIIIVIIIR